MPPNRTDSKAPVRQIGATDRGFAAHDNDKMQITDEEQPAKPLFYLSFVICNLSWAGRRGAGPLC
jgi:hypothetical protein